MFCAASSQEYDGELNNVSSVYREEVNYLHLSVQLDLVKNIYNDVNYIDILKISQLKNLPKQRKVKNYLFDNIISCFTNHQYNKQGFWINFRAHGKLVKKYSELTKLKSLHVALYSQR